MHEQKRLPEGQRGLMPRDVLHPYASSVKSIWAKSCVCTHGRILRYTKYELWTRQIRNDWPKETQKKYPIKVIQTTRSSETLSPWVCLCVYSHVLYSFFPLNTLLASLLSVFVRILSCQAKGPGPLSLTTGLVARISCCHHCEPASISGWEPKPQDQRYILSLHLAGEMLTDLPKAIRLRKNWVSMFLNMCFFFPF